MATPDEIRECGNFRLRAKSMSNQGAVNRTRLRRRFVNFEMPDKPPGRRTACENVRLRIVKAGIMTFDFVIHRPIRIEPGPTDTKMAHLVTLRFR